MVCLYPDSILFLSLWWTPFQISHRRKRKRLWSRLSGAKRSERDRYPVCEPNVSPGPSRFATGIYRPGSLERKDAVLISERLVTNDSLFSRLPFCHSLHLSAQMVNLAIKLGHSILEYSFLSNSLADSAPLLSLVQQEEE